MCKKKGIKCRYKFQTAALFQIGKCKNWKDFLSFLSYLEKWAIFQAQFELEKCLGKFSIEGNSGKKTKGARQVSICLVNHRRKKFTDQQLRTDTDTLIRG